jgi:cell wall assembly regulator SMI1
MIEDKVIELLGQIQLLGKQPTTIVPATDKEIKAFELVHKLTLPAEVKTWFQRCNGADVYPPVRLNSLFSNDDNVCSIDWYFKEYPEWKQRGWIPIADDGCGDLYILTTAIVIPSIKTNPVFFLDQADFDKPNYVVASGLWKFLFLFLEDEILNHQGEDTYWPFDKRKVITTDPQILECRKIPLPWEADSEQVAQ